MRTIAVKTTNFCFIFMFMNFERVFLLYNIIYMVVLIEKIYNTLEVLKYIIYQFPKYTKKYSMNRNSLGIFQKNMSIDVKTDFFSLSNYYFFCCTMNFYVIFIVKFCLRKYVFVIKLSANLWNLNAQIFIYRNSTRVWFRI